jgi:predicted membrane metal-binding protein
MKNNLPLLLIIASAILIIGDFIFLKGFDGGFWMSILSSLFIILSMVLLIRANKKRDQN